MTDQRDLAKEVLAGYRSRPVSHSERMRFHAWRCSGCAQVHRFSVPTTAPAPCDSCGCIGFVAVKETRQ